MIDIRLGAEESSQRHVCCVEFAQNLFLFFGRAHTTELGNKIADRDFGARAFRIFVAELLVVVDQRASVALELLKRIPVCRGGIAGPVFLPARLCCVMAK
jgi:hypothetical protein